MLATSHRRTLNDAVSTIPRPWIVSAVVDPGRSGIVVSIRAPPDERSTIETAGPNLRRIDRSQSSS